MGVTDNKFRSKSSGNRQMRERNDKYAQKSRNIQKSLTHRARVRQKYFKMLEQEGEALPKDEDAERARRRAGVAPEEEDSEEDNEEPEDKQVERALKRAGAAPTDDKSGIENSDDNDDDDDDEHSSENPERKRRRTVSKKKLLRQQIYEENKKREREIAEKATLRQKHRKQMTKTNKKGQPKLGARIDRLLDKLQT